MRIYGCNFFQVHSTEIDIHNIYILDAFTTTKNMFSVIQRRKRKVKTEYRLKFKSSSGLSNSFKAKLFLKVFIYK